MPLLRGRLRRKSGDAKGEFAPGETGGEQYIEIDPGQLSGVFAAPKWLRDAGLTSWLLAGVTIVLVGILYLASLTHTIFVPVVVAGVIAAVAGPLVGMMNTRKVPRGLGALIVMLLIVGAGSLAGYLILHGITSEAGAIGDRLREGADEIQKGLENAGISDGKSADAKSGLSGGASDTFDTLLNGVAGGIKGLSSFVFFLAMTILSLFFLLKDGPTIRRWAEEHMGVPMPVAHTVTERTLESMRGYFFGVTIVATFSAVLVGGGALLIGVPLAGTIAIVTFLGGYVPYVGAWSAGAFSVLLALGGAGPEAAGGMIVIQILSNGPFQQIVQPIAYGAALGIHPLAVLVVTIAGGALFGPVGLILSAPLTSAALKISSDLRAGAAETPPAAAPG